MASDPDSDCSPAPVKLAHQATPAFQDAQKHKRCAAELEADPERKAAFDDAVAKLPGDLRVLHELPSHGVGPHEILLLENDRTLVVANGGLVTDLADGTRRLRVQIMHPMDTGLVAGVPALYIERLELQDAAQQPWWRMQLHEPVSENPLLTVEMPLQGPKAFRLLGQDNNGNRIDAEVRA